VNNDKKFETSDRAEVEHFYNDLDEKKSHSSCCTCQTMAGFFIVIFIVLIFSVFYLYKMITSKKDFSIKRSVNYSSKNLESSLASPKILTDGRVETILTEDDLSTLVSGGLNFQSFVLREVQIGISPDEIIVYATLVKPLSSKIVVGVEPIVDNGKIVLKTKSINAGQLKISKIVLDQIDKGFDSSINARLDIINQKMSVEEIKLENHQLIVSGRIK